MTERRFLTMLIALGLVAGIGLAVTGCAPIPDDSWRSHDSYGTGQRGSTPNGGKGTVYQRDTPRAPQTPGGGD